MAVSTIASLDRIPTDNKNKQAKTRTADDLAHSYIISRPNSSPLITIQCPINPSPRSPDKTGGAFSFDGGRASK